MGILGHKVFVPLNEITDESPTQKKLILYLKERGAEATGILTSEGIIVCKGSKLEGIPTPSCPEWVKKLRKQNSAPIGSDFILTEDIAFTSPSAAAGFCAFCSINGRTAWITESGKTLKELEAEM